MLSVKTGSPIPSLTTSNGGYGSLRSQGRQREGYPLRFAFTAIDSSERCAMAEASEAVSKLEAACETARAKAKAAA